MAGHSKWANIKHRKGAQDAKRGKLFTKFIREITVAAKKSPDPANNPSLRAAIDKALNGNMKRDTIENTIKKASGTLDGVNYEEVIYEGYGAGGTAVLVECLTDNRNRTVAEIRHAFSKAGGNLGTDGSVAYLFNKLGIISYPAGTDEETIMEAALDAGADDVITHSDSSIDVLTSMEDFLTIKETLIASGFTPENAEITRQAETSTDVGIKVAEKILRLIERLEDLDDVQEVYSNADFNDEVMEQLAELD